ncbi:MAG: N-acetylmuramoyl-L-alanine amidase [Pseudobdellovibrionaceae bacterium]
MKLTWATSQTPLPLPSQKNIMIYLDPGHGGRERGATSEGLAEADLMLMFSKELKQAFEDHTAFQILTSRSQDKAKPLSDRVNEAHSENADLFISLHANSAFTSKAKGIEIFVQSAHNPEEHSEPLNQMISDLEQFGRQQTSFALSRKIKTEIAQNESELKKTPIRIKQAPFYVLAKTQIPSLLVEIGFLSHPREKQKLLQKNYRAQIAEEIVTAVKNFVDTRQLHKDFSDKTSKRILN